MWSMLKSKIINYFIKKNINLFLFILNKNSISFYGKADLTQFYQLAPLELIQSVFQDFTDNGKTNICSK